MRQSLLTIFRLGIKELRGLRADLVLVLFIVYTFTVAIFAVASGAKLEVENASVAIVDEDQSAFSARLRDALLPPTFKPPVMIGADEIDHAMDVGRYVFVIEIPANFERDILALKQPSVQINIDATAMSQAGNGASFIENIIAQEVAAAFPAQAPAQPISLVIRPKFNENLKSAWFSAIMMEINDITILSIILAGAALIREREHGTIEHLLVMPVTPIEIMLSKIWANGLVIICAATLSLLVVVERMLAIPINGSLPLFVLACVAYLFSVTSLGILIATASSSMAQFGLVVIPTIMVMQLLSGSATPMESMPVILQDVMQVAPSSHFVALAQAILYRGAGFATIWPRLLVLLGLGGVFFALALGRFRKALLGAQ